MKDPTHALYIDESGTKEYSDEKIKYGRGRSRLFVFGGVLVTIEAAGTLSRKIIEAKLNYFGSDSVEIKSTWLRNPRERRDRYLDKYSISEKELKTFVKSYYEIAIDTELTLLASIVDKQHVQEKYSVPWYAPAIAYEILLQRLQLSVSGRATVIIDDMMGKTPLGNPYKRNLIRHHKQLRKSGSRLIPGFTFDCLLPKPHFSDSSNSHIIQLADVVAYNVHRQFRDHGEEWETKGLTNLPTYDYFDKIASKFRMGTGKRIQGYGVVKFPVRNQFPWSVD